jgi:hypothetical protein
MRRFVQGTDRVQSTGMPGRLVGEDNPVRVIDVVVDELDLAELGFSGVDHRANLADSSLNKPGWGFRRTQV